MLELAMLTLAVVASIGPTNIFAIKEGVLYGAKNTFYIIFGGVIVDLFYANLAGFGLSIIGENIYFKTILLSIGTLVFLYLAYKGLKPILRNEKIQAAKIEKKFHPILTGIIMTLPNPFTIIFWTTAFASLTIGYKPVALLIIILGVGASWALIEAGMIHFTRKFINEKILKIIEVITSLILLAFATKFIIQILQFLA